MCGISAVVDFECSSSQDVRRAICAMHSALAHRGPDGEGFLSVNQDGLAHRRDSIDSVQRTGWTGVQTAFAFRRLRIQDLSADAAQPMCSADGQTWIIFNGEIYNFAELRRALKSLGHTFRTSGDTEVALAAYREWGESCFEKFNGMWAVLVLDLVQRRLIGSRDRLGIKPLFYSVDNNRLLLGSEAKAVALGRKSGAEVEPYRLQEFLLGFPPQSAELSFFKDVHPVPGGTVFTIDLDAKAAAIPRFRRFWDLADFHWEEDAWAKAEHFSHAASQFDELMRSSVEYQLASDVEVGCLLSGGLDTSLVARLVAEKRAQLGAPPASTFSIVYDDPEMTELPYVEAVVARGHLASHTFTMSPECAWSSVDRVVDVQGQPLLGQDLIAQYHAYRLARESGATVVLEGQGADEMLGGMPYYETPIFRELISRFQYAALMREIRSRARQYGRSSLSIARQYVWNAYRRKITERLLPITSDWLECNLNGGPGRSDDYGRDPSGLNRFLYHLVRHTNLPTVLLYQDRSSMAHGIESRVPFLDHRIVEFCFRLPPQFKVALGERKRILREVAKQYLPPEVLNRKDKKVFISKINWLPLRQHAAELREMAHSRTMQQLPWVNGKRMVKFVDNYLDGVHDNILAVWRLYTAWRWLETTPFGAGRGQC